MRQTLYFQKPKSNSTPQGWRRAFTLIEMLAVVSCIALLLGIVVPIANSSLQASTLTSAGNQVNQIMEFARQRAMSGNVLTAVVLMTKQGGAGGNVFQNVDGRAFTVLEFVPRDPTDASSQPTWKQIMEWTLLPDGVVVDVSSSNANANSFFTKSPSPFPFLTAKGAPVAYRSGTTLGEGSYAARIFVPSGGLLNPNDRSQFQLVMGQVVNGATQYQEKKAGANGPSNYYRISLIGATGRTKVERPSL